MEFTDIHTLIVWLTTAILGSPFGFKIFFAMRKIQKEYGINIFDYPLGVLAVPFTGTFKDIDKENEALKSLRIGIIGWNIIMIPGMICFIYVMSHTIKK